MKHSPRSILTLLEAYSESFGGNQSFLSTLEIQKERGTIRRFESFLKSTKKPFSRQNYAGHFCGSAWIVDATFQKTVLTHHTKLQKWIQLGGHADDDEDLFHVAWKEALEESGLKNIKGLKDEKGRYMPLDFSIHEIPEYKGVPGHLHYDVTFVFVAQDEDLLCSDESLDLRWFSFEEALKVCSPETAYQLHKLQASLKHRRIGPLS